MRIEAEDMTLAGFRVEANSAASGGQIISLVEGELTEFGSAAYTFTGSSDIYDIVVGYFDETDGASRVEIRKQGKFLDAWNFESNLGSPLANEQTRSRRLIASGLAINYGETFALYAAESNGEPARVDYIEFIPMVNAAQNSLRVEAENMSLMNFRREVHPVASGGRIVSLAGGNPNETGTASFQFTGGSGLYRVVVSYFDETDGASYFSIRKQGTLVEDWYANQNRGSPNAIAQTRTRRTVASQLFINQGETFQITASENAGEPARIDYIEFVPVTPLTINGTSADDRLIGDARDNTLNGFGGRDILAGGAGNNSLNGGSGIDTADYTQAANGIVANLNRGVVVKPIFGARNTPKIMPLGDSITAGEHRVGTYPGTYRIQLSNNLAADGLSVDFVGSQFNGPSSLRDKNHEGHGGWTIDQITDLVNSGIIRTYQPNIVLLMIGTNDALGASANNISAMYSDLSYLIDRISEQSSTSQILVSAIAPIDPAIKGPTRANTAKNFNNLLPDLVSDKVAQGKNVAFVNAGGSLAINDLVSDGVHPTATGYTKIANAWYDGLVERDTLTGIENVIGSEFGDRLIGNSQSNTLRGGAGNDTLTGGGGTDNFFYREPTEGNDNITDFGADDRFTISAAGFGGGLVRGINLSTTIADTGVFVSGSNPAPRGSSANFLYNTNTGILQFDVDGIGARSATTLATLAGSPSLSAAQFYIS